MTRRRTLLLFGAALPVLAACADDVPVADVHGADDGYIGTGLTDGFPLPDVELTDQYGQPYNLARDPGTPVVVLFFGYTNCPDVCPGILADIATARRRLEDGLGEHITPMMISTDPARDTPDALARYLERIDPAFVGLTGDLDLITRIANSMGIPIEEGKQLPSGGYEVDHGTQVLGIGADRRVQVVWTEGTSIADLKTDYATLLERQ